MSDTKYFIAADGGGTKLNLVLYDNSYRIIKSHSSAGINENRKSSELIKEEIRNSMRLLLAKTGAEEIERLSVSLASKSDVLYEAVSEVCPVKEYKKYNEGKSVLLAAGTEYGIVVQAGTGSDVFIFQPNFTKIIGGLGYVIGDEGSGFDIGVQSIKAAVKAYENRGPRTLLQSLIFEKFGVRDPRDFIENLVLKKDFKEQVAAVTYLTASAAKQNDEVALGIYKDAGKVLAEQTVYAVTLIKEATRKNRPVGKIIASGGAWKGSPAMFEAFREAVISKVPDAIVEKPVFEPIIGCVVAEHLENGNSYDEIVPVIKKNFRDYLYA